MRTLTKQQWHYALLGLLVLSISTIILFGWLKKTAEAPASVLPSQATTIVPIPDITPLPRQYSIGTSVEGRTIDAYAYGDGSTHLVFVGGIHGGYEWNSVLLAYTAIDHLRENPSLIPQNLTVTIIPSLNPDGLFAVVGKEGRFVATDIPKDTGAGLGRFNANDVDLNRNFDCKWQPESTWRSKTVSAGTVPFSEPEASAMRDFVLQAQPTAVIFWHSKANAVYASECTEGILPSTSILMDTYASAAEYPAIDSFDAYPITGDVEGWLASINIPAITVELKTHESIEWERNRNGIEALFAHYTITE